MNKASANAHFVAHHSSFTHQLGFNSHSRLYLRANQTGSFGAPFLETIECIVTPVRSKDPVNTGLQAFQAAKKNRVYVCSGLFKKVRGFSNSGSDSRQSGVMGTFGKVVLCQRNAELLTHDSVGRGDVACAQGPQFRSDDCSFSTF